VATDSVATEIVIQKLPAEVLHRARRIDCSRLKGRQEETTIYELQWGDEDYT
tara:strand:- start:186 stop:341 length:156 start_codon:yes stop_codon:yes gene_type:complete